MPGNAAVVVWLLLQRAVDVGGVKGRPCRQLPFVSDPSTAVSQAHNKVGMINGFFHEERDIISIVVVLCPDRETSQPASS